MPEFPEQRGPEFDVDLVVLDQQYPERRPVPARGRDPGGFLLATTHRAGNVDDPERLRALVGVLRGASDLPVVLPLHPRTRARLEAANLLGELTAGDRVRVLPPLGYVPFTSLLTRAAGVLTDSGGVQKEAYLAGIRCVTMRDRTEWVETVESGWNTLVDLDVDAARAALSAPLPQERPELYGDGHAGARVVAAIGTLTG